MGGEFLLLPSTWLERPNIKLTDLLAIYLSKTRELHGIAAADTG